MESAYVEQRDGGYYVRDTRISLDSLVLAFRRGHSPESIRDSFPLLSLAQVYGAIAHYLEHQAELDGYLAQAERDYAEGTVPLRDTNPDLWLKLERARREAARPTA